jgi:hypothetical protein
MTLTGNRSMLRSILLFDVVVSHVQENEAFSRIGLSGRRLSGPPVTTPHAQMPTGVGMWPLF